MARKGHQQHGGGAKAASYHAGNARALKALAACAKLEDELLAAQNAALEEQEDVKQVGQRC